MNELINTQILLLCSCLYILTYIATYIVLPVYVRPTLIYYLCRAGRIGPAALVLAGAVFSEGKSKISFLQKASNKQSASVILELIRPFILSYNR